MNNFQSGGLGITSVAGRYAQQGNWDWQDKDMKTAMGIGTIAGAGVGLGVASWLSAGNMIGGIYATHAVTGGATTATWNITSNALITANINMISSAAQGRDANEILLSGASGVVSGAIGGYVGGNYYNGDQSLVFTQKAIRATNYYTATINGALDRFTNSVYRGESRDQVLTNTLIGAAEGFYSGYLGNRNAITSLSAGVNNVKGFAGRYISSALSQSITSVPGLGSSIASYQLSAMAWYYGPGGASDYFLWGFLLLPPPGGPLYLAWLMNTRLYSSAVIDPFLKGGYGH